MMQIVQSPLFNFVLGATIVAVFGWQLLGALRTRVIRDSRWYLCDKATSPLDYSWVVTRRGAFFAIGLSFLVWAAWRLLIASGVG